jgi:hypothetical protein
MTDFSAESADARMDVTTNVTMAPCSRPSDDELANLELPHRPFPEGNGWYAHFLFHPGGAPAYKRVTHGDHDDRWYRALSD